MESWLTFFMVIVIADYGSTQFPPTSSARFPPFLCQHSSDQSGQVYIPNIPDFYFVHENAVNFRTGIDANLTRSLRGNTHIYKVPSESAMERNCSGTVLAIQYCYHSSIEDVQTQRQSFSFNYLSLAHDGLQFTVTKAFAVRATPRESICEVPGDVRNVEAVCCDTLHLDTDDVFQIPTTAFVYGITIRFSRLLAFAESATLYNEVAQFQTQFGTTMLPPVGSMFTLNESQLFNDEPLLLLRFILALADPVTTKNMGTGTESDDGSASYTGVIAGASAVGSIVLVVLLLILLIATLAVRAKRRRRNRRKASLHLPPPSDVLPDRDIELLNGAYAGIEPVCMASRQLAEATKEYDNLYSFMTAPMNSSTEMLSDEYNYVLPN